MPKSGRDGPPAPRLGESAAGRTPRSLGRLTFRSTAADACRGTPRRLPGNRRCCSTRRAGLARDSPGATDRRPGAPGENPGTGGRVGFAGAASRAARAWGAPLRLHPRLRVAVERRELPNIGPREERPPPAPPDPQALDRVGAVALLAVLHEPLVH